MSKELICVTCPLGCRLSVDVSAEGRLSVSGNRCPRGARYAEEELLSPKRVVTATCRTLPGGRCRVPVRTLSPFPRERVDELIRLLYGIEVRLPVARGDVVIPDALGMGVPVIATRTLE
jgi:CxxC motif-containing protein